ncbi:hypothetical protein SEMRO_2776_G336840.1 [Seminavis robusta]|uniref:Uncharacterized protein n=1 Tax=Seminavis robusta TaxID=568900 RepID=A0A9N8EXY3_9STRA|nr:hypothetical protein SEMRO_2776_G336840.1 [Seminavis robusta]|eukprot:Sro2776_g336840.1 n/a (162) ;mRNA; r:7684-8169
MDELVRMNHWFYAVFQKTVKTTNGKVIVKSHFHDSDCFAILVELVQDAHLSVAGSLDHVETLKWLTSVQYSPEEQGPAVDFIVKFDTVVTRYNDGQGNSSDRLTDGIQKLFLQRVFTGVTTLNDISAREHERVCCEGHHASFTYDGYKEVLLNAATFFDIN